MLGLKFAGNLTGYLTDYFLKPAFLGNIPWFWFFFRSYWIPHVKLLLEELDINYFMNFYFLSNSGCLSFPVKITQF